MALYSQINLYLDGSLLAENTTIETSLEADIQDVMTIAKNWAGITPSPVVRVVTATNVIPLSGAEQDFEELMLGPNNEGPVEVDLKMQEIGSGKICVTSGYIVAVPRSAGVGQTTTISFTFRGHPTKFEG
jgi:hypothetical protein